MEALRKFSTDAEKAKKEVEKAASKRSHLAPLTAIENEEGRKAHQAALATELMRNEGMVVGLSLSAKRGSNFNATFGKQKAENRVKLTAASKRVGELKMCLKTSVALFGDLAATAELTSGVSQETKTCVTSHLMEMARCLEELQHVPTELACFTATCQRWGSDLVDAGCKVMIAEASRANYGKAVLMFRRAKKLHQDADLASRSQPSAVPSLIQSPATLLFRASFDVITGNALVMAPGAADTSEVALTAGAAAEAEEDADADVQTP